jgi:carbon starvation protein
MKHYWFNALLSAGLMLVFAIYIPLNKAWLLFGTANQAVGALALIAISAWLLMYGRRFAYTLVPAIIMLVTTLTAFVMEIFGEHPVGVEKGILYMVTAIALCVLAFGVVGVAIRTFVFRRPVAPEPEAVTD